MSRLLMVLVVLNLGACQKEPTQAEVVAQTKTHLAAGHDEALYAMGWRSMDAAIDLIDDPAVGDAAKSYVQGCAGRWGSMNPASQDDPAAYWRAWFTARERSIKAIPFSCSLTVKPEGALVAESSRPRPD